MLGALLRIAAVEASDCVPISDYQTMYRAALQIADGDFSALGQNTYFHRFPHMTVYCIAMGAILSVFGKSIAVVKATNIVFKCLAIIPFSLIGKEIFGRKGGILCAFLFAIFPADIFYSPVAATENIAIFFLPFSFYFVVKAYHTKTLAKAAVYASASGFTLALGALFRNVAPLYIAGYGIGILVLFVRRTKLVSVISLITVFLVLTNAVSLMLYGSGITGYKLTQGLSPVSEYVLVGTNYETWGAYSEEDRNVFYEGEGDPVKINKIAIERIKERLTRNPEKIIPLLCAKVSMLWADGSFGSAYWAYDNNGVEPSDNYPVYQSISNLFFMIIVAFSAVGIVKSSEKKLLCMAALVIMASTAGLLMIEVQPRYAFSAAFMLLPVATGGILTIGTKKFS